MARTTVEIQVWNRALGCIGEHSPIQDKDEQTLAAEVCRTHWDDVLESFLSDFAWPFATKQERLTEAYAEWSSTTTYDADAVVRVDGLVYTSLQGSNTGNEVTDTDWWQYTKAVGVGWEHVYSLPTDMISPVALLADGQRTSLLSNAQVTHTIPSSQLADAFIVSSTKIPYEIVSDEDVKVLVTDADVDDDDFVVLEYICRLGLYDENGNVTDYMNLYPRSAIDALAWSLARYLALAISKDVPKSDFCTREYERHLNRAIAEQYNAQQRDPEPPTPSIAVRG